MNPDNRGFTIIEIVVVLVLISIIAAAIFGRSITTGQINFVGQVDRIRNHIRYPQSMAMKRNEIWGFRCDTHDYWIFTGTNAQVEQQKIPGENKTKLSLADRKISMDEFTVFFDKYGKPYSPDAVTPISDELSITISASSKGFA